MLKKLSVLTLVLSVIAGSGFASTETDHPKQMKWPFDGVFGTIDRQAAQRGYQVYKEVCSTCHSLKLLSYRQLTALGFSDDEIKTIAASYTVKDGPNDQGDMFDRPGKPSDRFVLPFANDNAARASNNGALPPDLSLIVKAREDGANYIYSILTGYGDQPASDFVLNPGMNYNPYFPGKQIAMPNPLTDGMVSYSDGTNANVEQMSKDVTIFLQWAAEPEMENRKAMGIKVILFLIAFTALFYIAKKNIWSKIEKK